MINIVRKGIIVSIFLSGLMIGCTSDEGVNPPNQVNNVEIPAVVSNGTTDFAVDLFKNLQQAEPAEENLFVSPLSLHIALGMLLNGAENETAAEILKTLKMEGISIQDLNKAYNTLLNDLPVADSRVALGLANSVWYKSGFTVETDFQNILKQTFNADITGLPFDDAAKDKINKWASDHTNGKIKSVIEQINPQHVMFLLNALYFKGDWKYQFDTKNTLDTPFTLQNGTAKQVKMMYTKADLKAAAGTDYNAVQLPYGNGQFNMTLIIPKGDKKIGDIISGLTAGDWQDLQANRLSEQNVEVGLPKFSLEYSANLNAVLEQMGIKKVFTDAAELGKINRSADLFVDFVKQDTYLAIDEKGTEAAAVTSIGIGLTSAGPEKPRYVCDRPFGLIISEKTSNTILFMGRIMNPESK
ncbi:hypothetical protein DYBT9275_05032 [Dyadobacter sp. CECT 9275]|uniref:Serpin domain-containing protein n=1 Tax=Dyadobacter helix TaxID=2822344 RepID=A0A916JGU7_9BACT|nr:serpin family protein [Dyadobacter sp. CECT 9275]CAG5011818.1 hypothetical protein DYBT9275_05032 [Dyadobacter sp. CECT 9275]